jgi:hypothetical protein
MADAMREASMRAACSSLSLSACDSDVEHSSGSGVPVTVWAQRDQRHHNVCKRMPQCTREHTSWPRSCAAVSSAR